MSSHSNYPNYKSHPPLAEVVSHDECLLPRRAIKPTEKVQVPCCFNHQAGIVKLSFF